MQRLLIYCSFLFLVSCKSKKEEVQPADNWVLTNKKVYSDKLNAFGFPDTTYTKTYTYENFNIKDSSETFAVSKYDDNRRLVLKSVFLVRKGSSPYLQSQSRYTYSGKYLATAIDEANGILTKHEKYMYDSTGKLLKSIIIRMKNFDKLFAFNEDEILQKEKLVNQEYDTLNITYNYDAANKNIGGEMVDNRGNLVRRDVNTYSGNSPISSYNFGPKGDTLQRIIYVQQGSKLTSQSESDDFIIATAMNSGYVTGKLTFDKKKNEKLRQEWTYAEGRLTGETVYIDQQKNTKQ
jgi:hypothetical protein